MSYYLLRSNNLNIYFRYFKSENKELDLTCMHDQFFSHRVMRWPWELDGDMRVIFFYPLQVRHTTTSRLHAPFDFFLPISSWDIWECNNLFSICLIFCLLLGTFFCSRGSSVPFGNSFSCFSLQNASNRLHLQQFTSQVTTVGQGLFYTCQCPPPRCIGAFQKCNKVITLNKQLFCCYLSPQWI